MDKEDIDLVRKAKEDPAKYELLYNKYADKVFNYFWYRVGHQKQVAEDLMQETFLRAFQSLPRFQMRTYSYSSYLLTIAHNLLMNYYRKPQMIPLEAVGDVPVEITQDIEKKDAARTLWRAIQQLPEKEKDVLLMKYRKDMSIKEIARVVGKSENAVKLLLSRARKRLAKHPYLSGISHFSEYNRKNTPPRFLASRRVRKK